MTHIHVITIFQSQQTGCEECDLYKETNSHTHMCLPTHKHTHPHMSHLEGVHRLPTPRDPISLHLAASNWLAGSRYEGFKYSYML